jgi:hypothetical protein
VAWQSPLGGEREAKEIIEPIIADSVEFLPLACPERALWIVNVLRIVDGLDMNQSDVVRFASTGRVMTIRRHRFIPDRLDGVHIFKLPGLTRGSLYVTEDLRDMTTDLVGVGWREVG